MAIRLDAAHAYSIKLLWFEGCSCNFVNCSFFLSQNHMDKTWNILFSHCKSPKKLHWTIKCFVRFHLRYRSYFSDNYLLGYDVSKKLFWNFFTEIPEIFLKSNLRNRAFGIKLLYLFLRIFPGSSWKYNIKTQFLLEVQISSSPDD